MAATTFIKTDSKDFLLRVTNVTLGYDRMPLLKDLCFEVRPGDYLAVVGENGSGKSTLIKTLLGLTPPLDGTIETGCGMSAGTIGYLPQQTDIQRDFPASVFEIVLSGCQAHCAASHTHEHEHDHDHDHEHGHEAKKKTALSSLFSKFHPFYHKEDKQRAKDAIERMGIASLSKRCYRELSGGQQQRVLLARALCATENILLLDEPVTGLDPKATTDLYELIADLNKAGLSVIMVSHDLTSALAYADHILHISENYFFGTTEEYRQSAIGQQFIRMEALK